MGTLPMFMATTTPQRVIARMAPQWVCLSGSGASRDAGCAGDASVTLASPPWLERNVMTVPIARSQNWEDPDDIECRHYLNAERL